MKNLVVIGSSNTDLIIKAERIPKPGETILGGEFSITRGGKGANQAVAAARMGGKVTFISKTGNDYFGKDSIDSFKKEGIGDHILIDNNTPSGIALITVNNCGENSIVVAPGANSNLSPKDIRNLSNLFVGTEYLLIQLEIPIETVCECLNLAGENNIKVILNPAPAQILAGEQLKQVFMITPNEIESEILTGIKIRSDNDVIKSSEILKGAGIPNVIITLGKRGIYIDSGIYKEFIPAFQVNTIDTTAAGDVFNGALAVKLNEGYDVKDSSVFACAAAALSVTRAGAQTSIPNLAEVDKFILQRTRT